MDKVDVIFPAYNEKDTIEAVLKEWQDLFTGQKIKYRFIVCEDGSTDGTSQLLRRLRNKYNLVLNQKPYRRGYGRAVMDGIKTANSRFTLCLDSDGQCDPRDFPAFWAQQKKSDIIIGWRIKRADNTQRLLFSGLFKTVFKLLFPCPIHDPSAPFVLFDRQKVLPHLNNLDKFKEGFWWGFIGLAVKKKLLISELKIHHRPRLKGNTQVYHLTKIPSIAARNLWALFRLRFS